LPWAPAACRRAPHAAAELGDGVGGGQARAQSASVGGAREGAQPVSLPLRASLAGKGGRGRGLMLRSAIVAAGLAAAGLAATGPTTAVAQTQIVDEFKFGVLAHDIALFGSPVEAGADVNFEMLFTPPDFLAII